MVFFSQTLPESLSRLQSAQRHHFGYNPAEFHFHFFIEKSKSGELEPFHIDSSGASENYILCRTKKAPPCAATGLALECREGKEAAHRSGRSLRRLSKGQSHGRFLIHMEERLSGSQILFCFVSSLSVSGTEGSSPHVAPTSSTPGSSGP